MFVQRSTCPPGTARKYSSFFTKMAYAVNPSFLTKKNQWNDSINPERIMYAGPQFALDLLERIYAKFDRAPRFSSTSYEAAELLKYFENITDTVLISLWNEFLNISDSLEVPRSEFIRILDAFPARPRFGTCLRIPGKAFGLWCLPKDLVAMIHFVIQKNGLSNVMQGARDTNQAVQESFGINTLAATDLYKIESGRIVATKAGKKHLIAGENR
ncbi:MAG: hypothetical protein ACE5OZ_18840 [Candidatus Heimdallarchaeota archaeon]